MTNEECDLVVQNMNLARKLAWDYTKKFNSLLDYDEMEAISYYALTKAAITFNPEKDNEFSTYAYKVIQNEIIYQINKLHINSTISLSVKLDEDFELEDIMPSDINISNDGETNYQITMLYKFINELNTTEKQIVIYYLKGFKVHQIAKILNRDEKEIHKLYRSAKSSLRAKFFRYWGTEF